MDCLPQQTVKQTRWTGITSPLPGHQSAVAAEDDVLPPWSRRACALEWNPKGSAHQYSCLWTVGWSHPGMCEVIRPHEQMGMTKKVESLPWYGVRWCAAETKARDDEQHCFLVWNGRNIHQHVRQSKSTPHCRGTKESSQKKIFEKLVLMFNEVLHRKLTVVRILCNPFGNTYCGSISEFMPVYTCICSSMTPHPDCRQHQHLHSENK